MAFSVEVDDVLEHLCYADELGGKIIDSPHEVDHPGGRATLAVFADPEGNVAGLSKGLGQRAIGLSLAIEPAEKEQRAACSSPCYSAMMQPTGSAIADVFGKRRGGVRAPLDLRA